MREELRDDGGAIDVNGEGTFRENCDGTFRGYADDVFEGTGSSLAGRVAGNLVGSGDMALGDELDDDAIDTGDGAFGDPVEAIFAGRGDGNLADRDGDAFGANDDTLAECGEGNLAGNILGSFEATDIDPFDTLMVGKLFKGSTDGVSRCPKGEDTFKSQVGFIFGVATGGIFEYEGDVKGNDFDEDTRGFGAMFVGGFDKLEGSLGLKL